MEKEIILSICIGTYNRKEILLDNLRNILEEKRADIEIVIVDNASDDGTWEALQSVIDDRVRVFRNDVNKGASFNWIRALLLGRGKYRVLLNDRDTIDMKRLASFLDFLYVTPNLGDVIVAMNGIKNVRNASDRACLFTKDSHPGNYVYSYAIMEKASKVLDMEILEGKKEFDERKYNISLYFQLVLFQCDKWYSYPERLTVVMPLYMRNKIKQQRIDPIHGEPWFDSAVRLNFLKEHTYICRELENFDLWAGFYRANLLIVLEDYANEYEHMTWWEWVMRPIRFGGAAKKILIEFELWNVCKRYLVSETFKAYCFWARRSLYGMYSKIMNWRKR